MKLLKIDPTPGTRWYGFVKWFCDNINFCHGVYYDTDVEKPANKLYNWFYKYWLFPFEQNDCLCCNTVRGMCYMAVLFIVWSII